MNHRDTSALFDLARILGSTPGRVLIEAAQMTETAEPDAPACLRHLRSDGIRRNVAVDQCASLLLTPVDSYARGSLDAALVALWQGSGPD